MPRLNREPWIELEAEVADVYRTLGFVVSRDELIGSAQVDVLAEKSVSGFARMRLGIEVKHTKGQTLPIDEVRSFMTTYGLLLGAGAITGAVLVCNQPFSRLSKTMIGGDTRYRLITLKDLRRELLIDDDIVRSWIGRYEQSQISGRFLDLRLRRLSKGRHRGASRLTDLLDVFDRAERPTSIVLFADYGSGKTTGLERLKYLSLKRYLDSTPASRIPLLLQLKRLLEFGDFDAFLHASLRRDVGMAGDMQVFWEAAREDRFLFLFDGFDEIAVQPTGRERAKYLDLIAPVLFGSFAAVLSSRPSYFAARTEYQTLLRSREAAGEPPSGTSDGLLGTRGTRLYRDLRSLRLTERGESLGTSWSCDMYEIEPLSGDQVADYLKRLGPDLASSGVKHWEDVVSFLDEVYDLSDLVTRPILLQMIVETILQKGISVYQPSSSIGAAQLYEVYCRLRVIDDYDRVPQRRTGIPPARRFEFAEWCAWKMNRQGRLYLSAREAEELATRMRLVPDRASASGAKHAIERVMADLRTCSFLTIEEDGDLRFIHKSFAEFFLASKIRQALISKGALADLERPLAQEVRYFLGSMTISDGETPRSPLQAAMLEFLLATNRLQGTGRSRESEIRSNVLGSLFYGPATVGNLDLRGGEVPAVHRRSLVIKDSELEGIQFQDLRTRQLEIRGSAVKDVAIAGSAASTVVRASRLEGFHCAGAGTVEIFDSEASVAFPGVRPPRTVSCERSRLRLSDGRPGQLLARDSFVVLSSSSLPARAHLVGCVVVVEATGQTERLVSGLGFKSAGAPISGELLDTVIVVDHRVSLAGFASLDVRGSSAIMGGYMLDEKSIHLIRPRMGDVERFRASWRPRLYMRVALGLRQRRDRESGAGKLVEVVECSGATLQDGRRRRAIKGPVLGRLAGPDAAVAGIVADRLWTQDQRTRPSPEAVLREVLSASAEL